MKRKEKSRTVADPAGGLLRANITITTGIITPEVIPVNWKKGGKDHE